MAINHRSKTDLLAILISILAVLAALWVHVQVFESMAHIEDEMAYLWQAQVIAHGELTVPSPASPKSFLVPFVVDYEGQRFGKYPLGWPVVLALGEKFGLRQIVNPLLAGLGVWFTYLLGKRIFGETVGVLAAFLTLISPFFLMNSGSLLSHPLGLAMSTAFSLAWLDAFFKPYGKHRWIASISAGAALGLLALSRPFTALAIAVPFLFHGLFLLLRGDRTTRRMVLLVGITAFLIASLHLAWQYAVTGDPLRNPYTLWWPYDRIGFGPGIGRISGGHNLHQAWINTRHSIQVGNNDLFGWLGFSWILLPFGVLAVIRGRIWRAILPVSAFGSLFVAYFAYWIGAWVFGPRYYYEGLFSLTLLSAAGLALLAGWPTTPGISFPNFSGWHRFRALSVAAAFFFMVCMTLVFYIPQRMALLKGLYGVERRHLDPFLTPQAAQLTPALVIVHTEKSWIEYGTLLELESPFLDTPFIFIYARSPEVNQAAAAEFPNRRVLHYYPLTSPFKFYETESPPE
jgi:hypothetical protein